MDPVQDQLMRALVAPAIQMFWHFLPWLVVLGLLVVLRDILVAWIEQMVIEFVRDVVGAIRCLFGTPRVSEEAIRRARGSRRSR